MKVYDVNGSFSFKIQSNSPGDVRSRLIRVIKQEGFEEKDFEISIDRYVPGKGLELEVETNIQSEIKVQPKFYRRRRKTK